MIEEGQQLNLDKETVEALREKAKLDLYFFAKGIIGFDWLDVDIHMPICRLLENPENTRLRIVLPRSWLKSTLCTIAYPIWRAIRDPNVRIAIVQNSHSNACKKLAVIRGKFETCALFRALFPELLPTKSETWTTDQLCVPRRIQSAESTFEAAGTRTKLTSRHYDVIIEDDTVAPDLDDLTGGALLPSKEDVDQAIGWHRLALPLLVDSSTGQIIIVGTRWFEKDLISWNTDNEPQYKGYIRAVRETNGLADEAGEITYPKRFNDKVLAELEVALGPYLYSCLYMNKPIRSTDMVFQPEWFQYYESPTRDIVCFTSVDPAGDPELTKGDPDYNVVITTGKDMMTGRIYVLDYYRARGNPGELLDALFTQIRTYKPVKVGVESVAYQRQLIYWIKERQRSENTYFFVEPITHGKRSKNVRIQGLQPIIKAGMLRFKQHHRLLVTELCAFPFAANDDLGDALAMQIPMWMTTRSKNEERGENPADDPFTFDNAHRELSTRNSRRASRTHAYYNQSRN